MSVEMKLQCQSRIRGQGERRASPPSSAEAEKKKRGAACPWVPLRNCQCALKKAPACVMSRPLVGAWLGVFCPCLGLAVGCSLLPTASLGPAAKRGPPETLGLLCVPHGGGEQLGWPAPARRGDAGLRLKNASFINPSAEEGGRNCHNNSDDRLI